MKFLLLVLFTALAYAQSFDESFDYSEDNAADVASFDGESLDDFEAMIAQRKLIPKLPGRKLWYKGCQHKVTLLAKTQKANRRSRPVVSKLRKMCGKVLRCRFSAVRKGKLHRCLMSSFRPACSVRASLYNYEADRKLASRTQKAHSRVCSEIEHCRRISRPNHRFLCYKNREAKEMRIIRRFTMVRNQRRAARALTRMKNKDAREKKRVRDYIRAMAKIISKENKAIGALERQVKQLKKNKASSEISESESTSDSSEISESESEELF